MKITLFYCCNSITHLKLNDFHVVRKYNNGKNRKCKCDDRNINDLNKWFLNNEHLYMRNIVSLQFVQVNDELILH